jgi:hypothetical protein
MTKLEPLVGVKEAVAAELAKIDTANRPISLVEATQVIKDVEEPVFATSDGRISPIASFASSVSFAIMASSFGFRLA